MVLGVVLFGAAALTIDVGAMYNARADLQDAADVAAMAGVSAMTSDQMMIVRQTGDSGAFSEVMFSTRGRVDLFAAMNPTWGTSSTHVQFGDIRSGLLDLTNGTSQLDPSADVSNYNAVEVTVYRNSESNGPVQFLFAPILGLNAVAVSATATAAYDDRFTGIDLNQLGDGMLPITLHVNEYEAQLVGGDDSWEYDPASESVLGGSDGIREVKVYPYDNQPGNFGLLNIGTPNQGVPALRAQIENGVSPADMEAEVGTDVLVFYDDDGGPVTYDITGDPGMKSSLESSFDLRIGHVVSFFLHDQQTGNGSNAVYRITGMAYGRLMEAELNGNPNQRGVWIQPVSYAGNEVIVDNNTPSSSGTAGRIVLAR